jgi:hypothetical protein
MASTLKLGSRGDEVKQLQELLNQKGANLSVDGIYGGQTAAAVKNYQGGNSLAVDGIVGNNTWGSLLGGASGSSSGQSSYSQYTTPYGASPTTPRPTYAPSAGVQQAQQAYQSWQAPGPYQSAWQGQLDELLGKIQNRQPFSYDFNADPIYKQYKDQYQRQGNLAMQDTTAQMAALSGGYGNSYAATAGNLAYQNSLQQLNNVIPELSQQAYGRYQDEGNQLYNQFGLVSGMEDRDYGRYRDTVGDAYNNRDWLYNLYNNAWNQDRAIFGDSLSGWEYDQDRAYQMSRDATADSQWEKEYALAKQQAAAKSSGSGSSGTKATVTFNQDIYNMAKGIAQSGTSDAKKRAIAYLMDRNTPVKSGIAPMLSDEALQAILEDLKLL